MFPTPSSSVNTSPSFFQPTLEPLPPIVNGIFDYNSAFAAFLKATDQKRDTARLVGAFANKLQEKKIVFDSHEMIKVADLGCADSSTCLGYLNQMEYPAGFDYLGFDINDKYISEAETILSSSTIIKKHTLIKEDVLTGGLSGHSSVQPKSLDLVFASHLAYYLKDEESGTQFVKDILNLLNDDGIAIFLHEDSTYYFRSTYNSNYKNISAPSLLKKSANDLLETPDQFSEISFTSKLQFTEMTEELWQATKKTASYKSFAHNPSFIDNLNKLSFIVQCDLSKLEAEGSLASFIDEFRKILNDNNNCFNLVTSMQVLASPQNAYLKEIDTALKEIVSTPSIADIDSNNIEQTGAFSSICYN